MTCVDYFNILENHNRFLTEFKREIIKLFEAYNKSTSSGITNTPIYRNYLEKFEKALFLSELLGSKHGRSTRIGIAFSTLDSVRLSKDTFEISIQFLKDNLNTNSKRRKKKIGYFSKEQRVRLSEAIHDYFEQCYYSSIVMAVSAIESKISEIMMRMNKNLNVEKMTLGQLISEYLKNPKKYKDVFQKHEELLNLCNRYRILSVHPKKEVATRRKALSILNLVFELFLDKELIETKNKTKASN